ncbi:hypothetical protein MASR2M15_10540 [Anaerolineales bacterium]
MSQTILQYLKLKPGNLALKSIDIQAWGTRVVIEGIYRHPPEFQNFQIILEDCRHLTWITQKSSANSENIPESQLLIHDLGEADYQRTAHFATTMGEVVINYRELSITPLPPV